MTGGDYNASASSPKCFERLFAEFDELKTILPSEKQSSAWIQFDEETPQYIRALLTAPLPGPSPYKEWWCIIYIWYLHPWWSSHDKVQSSSSRRDYPSRCSSQSSLSVGLTVIDTEYMLISSSRWWFFIFYLFGRPIPTISINSFDRPFQWILCLILFSVNSVDYFTNVGHLYDILHVSSGDQRWMILETLIF